MNIFKSTLLIFVLSGTTATAQDMKPHDMKAHNMHDMHDMKKTDSTHKPQAHKPQAHKSQAHKPWSMADEFWGDEAMAKARALDFAMMGAQ